MPLTYEQALANLTAGGLTGTALDSAKKSLAHAYGVGTPTGANFGATAKEPTEAAIPVTNNGVTTFTTPSTQTAMSGANIPAYTPAASGTANASGVINVGKVTYTPEGGGLYTYNDGVNPPVHGVTPPAGYSADTSMERFDLWGPSGQHWVGAAKDLAEAQAKANTAWGLAAPEQKQTDSQTKDQTEQQTSPTSPSGLDLTSLPSVNLQPGQTSGEVKALQSWLIQNGFNIPDGATGFYGPQTKAAVSALQQQLGVAVGNDAGFYGPKTRQAIQNFSSGIQNTPTGGTGGSTGNTDTGTTGNTDTGTTGTSTQMSTGLTGIDAASILKAYGIDSKASNPAQQFVELYSQTLDKLGVMSIKKTAEDFQKQYADVQNELNDKISDINEDPWLSEGVRVSRIKKLQDRYELRLNTLSNQQKLAETLYEQGVQQAQYLATGATNLLVKQQELQVEAVNKAIDIAERQAKAIADLKATQKPIEVSPGATLYDPKTGKAIYTAPTTRSQNGTDDGGTKLTEAERKQVTIDTIKNTVFSSRKSTVDSSQDYTIPGTQGVPYIDGQGFATVAGWKDALAHAGVPREDFIKEFNYVLRPKYDNQKRIIGVSDSYGLSPAELKLIGY